MTKCPQCSAPVQPGAAACAFCGASLGAAPAPFAGWPQPGAAPAPGWPRPAVPPPQAQWAPPPLHAAYPTEPEPPFMVWGIVALVLVFAFGSILSLPGAILAFTGRSAWTAGDREKGRSHLRLSIGFTIGGLVLGVLAFVAFFVFVIAVGNA